jgi:hypothetical protein
LVLPSDDALTQDVKARLAAAPGILLVEDEALARLGANDRDDAALQKEISATFARVEDAWRRLDVDEATRLLLSLENARAKQLGCPEQIALAAKLSFWLGAVAAARNDKEKATERFATALSIDPSLPIDKTYFPPKVVAIFDQVKKRKTAMPTGGLSVVAEPEGAHVFVDGKAAGAAPSTITASAGEHHVCIRRVGSNDWAARIRVTAGRVDSQRVFLQRASKEATAAQLGALIRGGGLKLEDPTHVEALGTVLSADVVARAQPPDDVLWREVRAPSVARQATASRLSRAVFAGPKSDAAPSLGAPTAAIVELEASVSGGPTSDLLRGSTVGGRVAGWWYAWPSVSVGLSGGVAAIQATLPFALDPTSTVGPFTGREIATSAGQWDASLAAEVRFSVPLSHALRLKVEAGPEIRYSAFAVPVDTDGAPSPLVTFPSPSPSPVLLQLGPRVAGGISYVVLPQLAVFADVGYSLLFPISALDLTANIGPIPDNHLYPFGSMRHNVAFDLGAQWRFGH